MKTLSGLISLLLSLSILAQTDESTSRTYIILDGSGSMWGRLEDDVMKIEAARNALNSYLDNLSLSHQVALRAYGHNREKDCQDTELLVPFTDVNKVKSQIKNRAETIKPTGRTPIGISLMKALDDIGDQSAEIILISDGLETCNIDPCALMNSWKEKKIDIKVHVVGLGLTEKERNTLMCIADVSGGQFRDAQSAEQLTESLKGISNKSGSNRLAIRGLNADGEKVWVHCIVEADGQEKKEGRSDRRFGVPLGEVKITVGVKTQNGTVYKPVEKTIQVTETGESDVEVVVIEPPLVRTKFMEKGKERSGVVVGGYQDNEKQLGLRHNEWLYVMPGTYEFRADLNQDNKLSITETVVEGEKKDLVFKLVNTVRTYFVTTTSMDNVVMRFHSYLYQNGEEKYYVHRANGKDIIPGTYDVHLGSKLNPHIAKGVVVSDEDKQKIDIVVPVGIIKVDYVDQSGAVMDVRDKRLWLSRIGDDGKLHSDRLSRANGEPIYLMAGRYQLKGWSKHGNFEIIEVDVNVGETKSIKMKDRG